MPTFHFVEREIYPQFLLDTDKCKCSIWNVLTLSQSTVVFIKFNHHFSLSILLELPLVNVLCQHLNVCVCAFICIAFLIAIKLAGKIHFFSFYYISFSWKFELSFNEIVTQFYVFTNSHLELVVYLNWMGNCTSCEPYLL